MAWKTVDREVDPERLERQERDAAEDVEDARAEERGDEPEQARPSGSGCSASGCRTARGPARRALTIVAKLSSVRIITAASLETSVPVMPIATPMSAVLRAGASFTPSPVMATMWPLRRRISTRRTLSSGATRAMTPMSSIWRIGLVVGHRRELGAGDRPALDAELACDRLGGDGVVAGDHPDLDAGRVRLGDGVPSPRAAAGRRCRPVRAAADRRPAAAGRRSGRTSPDRSPAGRSP